MAKFSLKNTVVLVFKKKLAFSSHQVWVHPQAFSCGEAPECTCPRRLGQPAQMVCPTGRCERWGCRRRPGHPLSTPHTYKKYTEERQLDSVTFLVKPPSEKEKSY